MPAPTTQKMLSEAIHFAGCFTLRRVDVHAIVKEDTGSCSAADFHAFGPLTRLSADAPITKAQFRAETA